MNPLVVRLCFYSQSVPLIIPFVLETILNVIGVQVVGLDPFIDFGSLFGIFFPCHGVIFRIFFVVLAILGPIRPGYLAVFCLYLALFGPIWGFLGLICGFCAMGYIIYHYIIYLLPYKNTTKISYIWPFKGRIIGFFAAKL